ncbi:MAG TPA: hypothetical protein VL137_07585 [Polyangiaceae bacterium]|jgi:hypothetical protein|nr:hypothetical protein [Polyangiaceae bacterium]
MKSMGLFAVLCGVVSCSAARVDGNNDTHPTLTFPAHFDDAPAAPNSAAPQSSAAPAIPDPPAASSTDHWLLEIRYQRGVIQIASVQQQHFAEPREGTQHTGRFALELWANEALLQRLKFDFPLLAAESPPSSNLRPLRPQPLFGPGAEVSARLMVPIIAGVTRAQIVDRHGGQVTAIAWPPQAQPPMDASPNPPSAAGASSQ